MKSVLSIALVLTLTAPVARAAITPPELEAAASAIEPKVIEWRRDFHRNPELANHEVRTSAIVAEYLRSLGLKPRTGMAHTGVVAVIEGQLPGPTILLRADMDALPILEENDVEYRSQTPGVMHACGHDAHTAMLLGVSRLLIWQMAQGPAGRPTLLARLRPARGPAQESA